MFRRQTAYGFVQFSVESQLIRAWQSAYDTLKLLITNANLTTFTQLHQREIRSYLVEPCAESEL